ncbi:MAG: hypothetical protein ACREAL_07600 [Nitrosopumilaceae archaeon]
MEINVLIVVVFLQHVDKVNHQKNVQVVLGMNAVVGIVFTLDKKMKNY